MAPTFLRDGPADARATLLFAHGAGAAMDNPTMTAATGALVAAGLQVIRFEFEYMAARRLTGGRKPPPKAEKLTGEYLDAVAQVDARPLIIGGKSMGGRVASMVADDLFRAGRIAGLFCLGYPFHPPAKPDKPRIAHLETLTTPTLICQGTRDPFGTRADVAGYGLSGAIRIAWFEDGDHDLKPRKRVTGLGLADHLSTMANTVADWTDGLWKA